MISASELQHDEATKTIHARGQVRIAAEYSTITADEADIHHLTTSRTANDLAIDLRGIVRVVIAPSTAVTSR